MRTVFSSSSAPRSGTIGNHRPRSFYILVYNSFWLASVAPRRTICDEVSEIPAVVDSESHGSNMGFVGESGVCSFSGNRVRHGTPAVSGQERFSSFIRRPFSPKHETANQQDRPAWTVFSSRPSLVLELSKTIDVVAALYTCI